MLLHLSLVSGPGGPEASARELVVDGAVLDTGEKLVSELARGGTPGPFHVAGRRLDDLVSGCSPLVSGAVIVAGPSGRAPAEAAAPGLLFVVHAGPDAGQVIPLSRGTYRIGRAAADITIRDPLVSRRHAVLVVGRHQVLLRDRHSANGTVVDGAPITETPITVESSMKFGGSRCRLAIAGSSREAAHRLPASGLDGPVPVGVPLPPPAGWGGLLAAVVPLVVGGSLALATGMVLLLAFSAAASLAACVPLATGVLRGRVFRRAVAAAAAEDLELRKRRAPDLGQLVLALLAPSPTGGGTGRGAAELLRERSVGGAPGITLRLGTADQPADLAVTGAPPGWQPPVLSGAPLTLRLPPGSAGGSPAVPANGAAKMREPPLEVSFEGPKEAIRGAARSLLLQLACFPEPMSVVCWGTMDSLPLEARFLPGVQLATRRESFLALISGSGTCVALDFGPAPAPLPLSAPVHVLRFGPRPPARVGITLAPGRGQLRRGGTTTTFLPDLMGEVAFERAARALGGQVPDAPGPGGLPRRCAVFGPGALQPSFHLGTTVRRWAATDHRLDLPVPVGVTPSGPVDIDLTTEGPHLLAAGTTGAGKSEFLRALVLGLAARYSPRRINFLLIDFKGGSGLEPLADLPHAVGLLTDLSEESVSRALRSLRAELIRREALFAACSAGSIDAYHRAAPGTLLPRLVVVIDEYRLLAEEVPDAMEHLMRIAALGRSLGVHLVLATQRPQGAVTPEIRANVTARVVFRVQSGSDSLDLVGTAAAASIPVGLPGRGLLAVGPAPAVEFQAACCEGPQTPAVQDLATHLEGQTGPGGAAPSSGAESTAETHSPPTVAAAVRTLAAAAAAAGIDGAWPPVLPPLPAELLPAGPGASVPGALTLGLLDLPDRQSQPLLRWAPGGSHLAFIGSASSGASGALRHTLTECLLVLPDAHLYILDGDFTLVSASDAPQTGAYAAAHEPVRAERILLRLAAVVLERLSAPAARGTAPILLAVSGWGRWAGAFRSRRFSAAEDLLHDIVRDGPAAGVSLVITGERELTAARFLGQVPNRVYLPLGTPPEVTAGWPRLPPVDPVPGRGVAVGRFGTARSGPVLIDDGAPAQLTVRPRAGAAAPRPPQRRPFRVDPLPVRVRSRDLAPATGAGGACQIPIGIGGDEPETVFLGLPAGSLWAAVGPPVSGRSTLLALLEHQAPPWLYRLRTRDDPAAYWRAAAGRPPLATDPARCLLLIDDADTLPDALHPILEACLASGARAVLTAGLQFLLTQRPLARLARAAGRGVILAPRSDSDGEAFGVRLEAPESIGPPGRAVVLDSGRQLPVQLAQFPEGGP
ncbi:FtsK/SpoIIIE domain-containing protein [Arthrobacter zhaoguopingii]|uniref:FtsK/SpoIIIE domain-containing protein n=1 Tax=Arthrobacter zhaoguopingii TaxID=2681491 RepID=UPI00135CC11D|nr:FtsK/SpoIIIE domain-containing protein [Arthrobacter zhaoguopingii]